MKYTHGSAIIQSRGITMNQTELMTFCSKVMGSNTLARAWMSEPAMSLNYRCPCKLMDTVEGRAEVEVC